MSRRASPSPPDLGRAPDDALAPHRRQMARVGARGVVLAVAGASGGLGASVFAVALAVRAAAAGLGVCAVDLDPLGGGLDVTFGLEQTRGVRWPDLALLDGQADGAALLPTLPSAAGVRVLSHSRLSGAVTVDPSSDPASATVEARAPTSPPPASWAARRGAAAAARTAMVASVEGVVAALAGVTDLVVLDLPLRSGVGWDTWGSVDRLVLLTGTELRGVAALAAAQAWLDATLPEEASPDSVVLLRSSRDDPDLAAFVEAQLSQPVLGILPDDRSVSGDLVHGVPPGGRRGPLAVAAERVLADTLASHGRVGATG